jgi:hypothetical protein
VVTLVNVSTSAARTVVVQGGAFAEHQIQSVELNGKTVPVNASSFTLKLPAGAGGILTLTMKRYANSPTEQFPF